MLETSQVRPLRSRTLSHGLLTTKYRRRKASAGSTFVGDVAGRAERTGRIAEASARAAVEHSLEFCPLHV
jgi:hypothetical protein